MDSLGGICRKGFLSQLGRNKPCEITGRGSPSSKQLCSHSYMGTHMNAQDQVTGLP